MNEWYGALFSLGGVIIGGILSYSFQTQLLKKQMQIEDNRFRRDKLVERLKLYGQVLKVDGELMVVELLGGNKKTFNLTDYINVVRPTFYENFYLIDESIRNQINQLDLFISSGRFFGDIDEEVEDSLATQYFDIIDSIKLKFKYYQPKVIFDDERFFI